MFPHMETGNMPHPLFTIAPDRTNEFLRLTLTGSWSPDIVALFEVEVYQTLKAMIGRGGRPGHFLTLVDMRDKQIVPQNVATDMARLIRPDSPSKRIALIASSALHKMQVKRVAGIEKYAFFDTEEPALTWLFDGDRDAVAAHLGTPTAMSH